MAIILCKEHGVCSIPECIISVGPCTGWPYRAHRAFSVLFPSVCISSHTIQARLYWKLWAWTDILPFKIKCDFWRCILRNQISHSSLKLGLSLVSFEKYCLSPSLWCVWLRVTRCGDVSNWRDMTEKSSCVMLPVRGARAAEDEKVLRRATGPCGSAPRRKNSQNNSVISDWGGELWLFQNPGRIFPLKSDGGSSLCNFCKKNTKQYCWIVIFTV